MLHVDLLIQLVHADGELLDLLGVLAAEGLLVLDLGADGGNLLLLALDSLGQLGVDPLEVRHGLLGQLQVSLDLPPHLLSITLGLLLTLQSVLALVQGLLKLALNLGQVVAPVLGGLDVLLSLLPALSSGLLVLAKLGDKVLLVSNLLAQSPDLAVLGHHVILALLDGGLQLLDLLPQAASVSSDLASSLLDTIDGVVLTLDAGVGLVNLLPQVVPGILKTSGLVDDFLNGRTTGLESKNQLILLGSQLGVDIHHSLALAGGAVNVGLGLGDLVLVLLLVLAELGALEVGLDGQPKLHPEPGLGDHHGLDGPLAGVQGELLILQLLELHTAGLASGSGLQPGEDRSNLVLTGLLHPTEDTSSEEDLGVTKTELLLVKLDGIHDGSSSSLVVLGLGHSLGSHNVVASLELGVQHFVGEASSADGNTGQHTVALVLVHDQAGLHTSGDLVGVGHHATDEVGVGLVEGGHQVIKLTLEEGGHSLAASLLLPVLVLGGLQGLAGVVSETLDHEGVASILDQLDDGVVEGILVLLEPSGQVVRDSGGVVDDGKVRIRVRAGVGLSEVGPLAQQVLVELGAEGLVSGLGEERILLKDGKEAHGLLKHVNARLQVHSEVHVGPIKTLPDVFLLLKGEHVLVEELLQLLVDVVDTDLLETVVIKDLKAGNVKHTNVVNLLHGGVNKSLVTLVNHNPEGSFVDSTSNTGHRVGGSGTGGALVDPLRPNLQLGLAEVGDHPLGINAGQLGDLVGVGVVLDLGLLFLAHGDKVLGHVAHVHHAGGVLVHIVLLILGEAERHEGLVSELHVLLVVNGGDSQLALGHVPVVQDLVGQKTLLLEVGDSIRHDVVESVVATLQRLLVSQTRLLKQIDNHVSSGQLSRGVEMDTDKFTKTGGVVIPHSLGITPGLQHGVGGHNLVLKGGLSLLPLAGGADGGEVGNDLLGVLGLSGTRLSRNQDGLVAASNHHALVGALGNGKDMGRALVPPLAHVQLHGAEGVDREPLVGVDGNTEEARVGVDQLVDIPDNRVPVDAGVTQEGKTRHVIGAVKLGRVDLVHNILLEGLHLSVDVDDTLAAILGLQETLKVTSISLVGDPDRLLGVIRLLLELDLELRGDQQPGAGVRIRTGGLLDMARHGLTWCFQRTRKASPAGVEADLGCG